MQINIQAYLAKLVYDTKTEKCKAYIEVYMDGQQKVIILEEEQREI